MNGSPIISPSERYEHLPYQYPIIDQQKVLRIPVAGPEPFNNIVVVRCKIATLDEGGADNELHRNQWGFGTNFTLIGFDPRVPPPFRHSTTAAIQMIQTSDDSAFVSAVDEVVSGFFDDSGRWTVVLKVGHQWDQVRSTASAYISSWVLCYEPPPLPNLPRGERSEFENYGMPPYYRIIEREPAATSDTDRGLERFVKRNGRRRLRKLERFHAEESNAKVSAKPIHPAMTVSATTADDLPIVIPPVKPGADE